MGRRKVLSSKNWILLIHLCDEMKFPESTKLELAGFYQSWFIVNFRPRALRHAARVLTATALWSGLKQKRPPTIMVLHHSEAAANAGSLPALRYSWLIGGRQRVLVNCC